MSETIDDPKVAEEPRVEPVVATGKRKRTGKQREERKRAAEQAKLDALESGETPGEIKEVAVITENSQSKLAETPQENPVETEEAVAEAEVEAPPVLDLAKVSGRIPQALKTLNPILKKAKTVETQRLIKKIKQLRTKTPESPELPGLEEQLELLHHIPLGIVAHSFLSIKLKKHHLLKSLPLPDHFMPPSPPSPPSSSKHVPASPLYVKVENRILSSKGVGEAAKAIVAWTVGEEGATLRAVAGGATKKKVVPKPDLDALQKMRLEAMGTLPDMIDDVDEEQDVPLPAGDDEDEGNDSDRVEAFSDDDAADAAGWESGSVSGGEDDDGEDSGASEIDERPTKRAKAAPVPSVAAVKAKAKPAPRAPPVNNNTTITTSTFLPTLATGFYAGDSDDSDPDDDAGLEGVIGSAKGERKNRRGQRARQAIWEKKYGRGAKHIVKSREEEQAVADAKNRARGGGSGWGARGGGRGGAMSVTHGAERASVPVEGATRGRGGFRGGRGGFAGRGGYTGPSASVRDSVPAARPAPAARAPVAGAFGKPAEDKSVHPSWEAARLRKQKEMAMAIPTPGTTTAKKIVFD